MYSPYQEAVQSALGYNPFQTTAGGGTSLLEQLLAREAAANNVAPTAPQAPAAGGTIANNADLEALRTALGIENGGSPAGAPAPNAPGFNDSRGLGNIGGAIGMGLGPAVGAVGRGIGSAVGTFSDASRANAVAAALGLDAIANPFGDAAAALGRSLGMSATGPALGMLGSAIGVDQLGMVGGLVNRGIGALAPAPNYGLAIANAINQHISTLTEMDPMELEDLERGLHMRAAAGRAARSDVGFDMDPEHESGRNPSYASMDYYGGSGLAGMDSNTASFGAADGPPGSNDDSPTGGYGGAARGGLATKDGFRGPDKYAGGGLIELAEGGKIAIGPGGGLDDLIPTSIDGRRAAALSDGEFVVPADVVSMMGDGSSNAGARRLYDMVRQIRQAKTGTARQAGPLPVGKILERTAS